MKEFFKEKSWDDYLAMGVIFFLILGLILFVVGFYWGFDADPTNPIASIIPSTEKTSVAQITKGNSTVYSAVYPSIIGDKTNLFDLVGNMDANWGTAYGMAITAVVGFSFIMLSIALIIFILVAGLVVEIIIPKIKAKKA